MKRRRRATSRRPTSHLVSVILAVAAAISVVILTVAALIDAGMNPNKELSTQYASLLTGTLGVLVGALAGAIGGRRDDEEPPTSEPENVKLEADTVRVDPMTGSHARFEAGTRTVTGLVVPWHEIGQTTLGRLMFEGPAALRVPGELSRCKLYLDHTGNPRGDRPVGFATGFHVDAAGLHMSFQIARTPDGDAAIQSIRERIHDAFSAELAGIQRAGERVTDSLMTAVALVPTPAFASARVHELHAQFTNPDQAGATTVNVRDYIARMMQAGASEAEARAAAVARFGQADVDAVTPDQLTDAVQTPDQQPPTPAPEPAQPAQQLVGAGVGSAAQAAYTPRPLVVPAGVQELRPQTAELSLSEAARTLHLIQTNRAPDVAHAALANVTASGIATALPPQWLAGLWEGNPVPRRVIPLLDRQSLNRSKIEAYEWTQKPMVAAYAGDKADIPTNPVSVAPRSADAVRWAGGHDLDRKFYDFGETEIIESYWRAMNASYALVTDQAEAAWLVANATAVVEPNADDLITALIAGQNSIEQSLNVDATFYLANPADKWALYAITKNNLSAFIDMFNIDLNKIVWTSAVTAGSVVVGTKPAITYFELPGSPLRVEAEHLSAGGRDAALFGYTATMLNAAEGLVSVAFPQV